MSRHETSPDQVAGVMARGSGPSSTHDTRVGRRQRLTDSLPSPGSPACAGDDGSTPCCEEASGAAADERAALIRQAFRLEWITIGWMTVEGAVAIAAGV